MAKRKRDLTMEQQLARGPMDLPFLMLVLLLTGIGVIMVFSASFATAYYEGRIFHSGACVATHMRSFKQGGYTWVKEHLPSQTQVLRILTAVLHRQGSQIRSGSGTRAA